MLNERNFVGKGIKIFFNIKPLLDIVVMFSLKRIREMLNLNFTQLLHLERKQVLISILYVVFL